MKPLTLEETIAAMEGTIDRPLPMGSVVRVATDSRTVSAGDLFFAIHGQRFDGHDFVGEAFTKGATAAVVRNDFSFAGPPAGRAGGARLSSDPVLIRVDDPLRAMGRLARYYRRSVMGGALTVVAVTGSNGKTTTKAMIAHVLEGRWPGKASIKSYNNAIGVPLTLLSAEAGDRFVVCEVGTNAPGEIALLSKLIEPEIAVITGVSEAHLEGLGSLEKITAEKLSLLQHLRPDGCAVVSVDHEVIRRALKRDHDLAGIKCVTFGRCPDADLRLTSLRVVSMTIEFTVNDRFDYRLSVLGRHNVFNALAAIGVARRFGMDHQEIAGRLESFALPPMRLECERVRRLTLINDAYNANPASLAAAVEVLLEMKTASRRVLIMGDMRELGAASHRLHREAAQRIGQSGIELVITVGKNARLMSRTIRAASGETTETHAYASPALARRRLVSHLQGGDTVLVKGSRALELEKLVNVIREWAGTSSRRKAAPPKPGPAPRRLQKT